MHANAALRTFFGFEFGSGGHGRGSVGDMPLTGTPGGRLDPVERLVNTLWWSPGPLQSAEFDSQAVTIAADQPNYTRNHTLRLVPYLEADRNFRLSVVCASSRRRVNVPN